MADNESSEEKLRYDIEQITYWMYESSGNSKYVLAGRKPLHPDEATAKLVELFTTAQLKLIERILGAKEGMMDEVIDAVPVTSIEQIKNSIGKG